MRYFLFSLLLVFCGCSSYDYKVSSLPSIKLTDNKKGLVYRIERDAPEPYIILDGALYIPDRYNILCSDEIQRAKYIRYQLR